MRSSVMVDSYLGLHAFALGLSRAEGKIGQSAKHTPNCSTTVCQKMALGLPLPGAPTCSAQTRTFAPPSCLPARLALCQAPAQRAPHSLLCRQAKGQSRRRAPATWTCQAAQQATANAVSTVKIITQGRNVTVTPAIREYVVRIWLLMRGS